MTNYSWTLSSTSANTYSTNLLVIIMQQIIFTPIWRMATLSLSIQTKPLKLKLIGFCCETEATNTYSLTRLAFYSVIILIFVIDYHLQIFGVTEIRQAPLQNSNSNLCGLFCLHIAHYVFGANFHLILLINEQELLKFVKHFI